MARLDDIASWRYEFNFNTLAIAQFASVATFKIPAAMTRLIAVPANEVLLDNANAAAVANVKNL